MHELSFAEQILDAVQEQAAQYPNARVVRIKLRASEMLALEPASLRFCLEGIAVGTPLEGALVEMEEAGLEMECPNCGRVPIRSAFEPVCPQCGHVGQLALGTELIIEEIELDDEEDSA